LNENGRKMLAWTCEHRKYLWFGKIEARNQKKALSVSYSLTEMVLGSNHREMSNELFPHLYRGNTHRRNVDTEV
jgi:hypothetical protein